MIRFLLIFFFFFFNDTATTEIYTLSLHDALPISGCKRRSRDFYGRTGQRAHPRAWLQLWRRARRGFHARSEEHTSELQSQSNLVCRLLLEKKKKDNAGRRPHMTNHLPTPAWHFSR